MLPIDRLPQRFTRRISVAENGCWLWSGSLTRDGYGQISYKGTMAAAHRVVKRLLAGEFKGELDHLCRARNCVNPEHPEIVTHRENTLRGNTIPAAFVARDQCKHGHELSGPNVTIIKGARVCRECKRRAGRATAAKARARKRKD